MNWRRLCIALQNWMTIGLASAFSAGFWSFLASGICRMAFKLGDNQSMLLIGVSLFAVLFLAFAKCLPKPLRKAGMLSQNSKDFDCWFKSRAAKINTHRFGYRSLQRRQSFA